MRQRLPWSELGKLSLMLGAGSGGTLLIQAGHLPWALGLAVVVGTGVVGLMAYQATQIQTAMAREAARLETILVELLAAMGKHEKVAR